MKSIKKVFKNLLRAKKINDTKDSCQHESTLHNEQNQFFPPGHFSSPIPSLEEIKENEKNIFNIDSKSIPSINLNEGKQLKTFDVFKRFYAEIPFKENKQQNLRYFFENPAYSYSDAIFLYCMIRYLKPQKIIEVGSGYSSCVILDTNEIYCDNNIECTFIEPYPQLLESLITEQDKKRVIIIPKRLQDIELSNFKSLDRGDILFIDSTHVSKINSDVNYIFFDILPSLNSGVYIHFHDIFYPFEYPKEWIYQGIAWNEAYLLRAFLQYNDTFEIVFFNTFMEHFHEEKFNSYMPLCMKNRGGSIWIRKK